MTVKSAGSVSLPGGAHRQVELLLFAGAHADELVGEPLRRRGALRVDHVLGVVAIDHGPIALGHSPDHVDADAIAELHRPLDRHPLCVRIAQALHDRVDLRVVDVDNGRIDVQAGAVVAQLDLRRQRHGRSQPQRVELDRLDARARECGDVLLLDGFVDDDG